MCDHGTVAIIRSGGREVGVARRRGCVMQRWSPVNDGKAVAWMEPTPAGRFVKAREALARIAELEAALAEAQDMNEGLLKQNGDSYANGFSKGVREGIERVRAEALAPPAGLACDLALAAFKKEQDNE